MNIRVDLKTPIKDGTEVIFRSPVDCSEVTGLKVYYKDDDNTSKEFAFADAHGNNVGDIDHLFAENVVVKVILDVTTGMAFVQNADTNAYIERTFVKTVNGVGPDENGNVIVEGGGDVSSAEFEAFVQEVQDAIGTILTETEIPDEPDEPDEPEIPEEPDEPDEPEIPEGITYLPVVIKERWNGSPTPTTSQARARSERIERTDAMKSLVFGSGCVSQNIYGSNDGVNLESLTIYADLTEFDLSAVKHKYLYIDIKKADKSVFTEQDDVSKALGILATGAMPEIPDEPDEPDEPEIPEEPDGITYLPIVKGERWNYSPTPTISRAVARTERIERTDAMKAFVFGEGYKSKTMYGSDDGVTLTSLDDHADLTYFDISNVTWKYLYVDFVKNDKSVFTEQDDVSKALGISVTGATITTMTTRRTTMTARATQTNKVLRKLGKEVGELCNLETEDKSSIVNAINEVFAATKNIPEYTPEQGNADDVRDAIGYVVVGEKSAALTAYPRKRYNGNAAPTVHAKRAIADVYTKSATDHKILLAEGYCLYYVWVSTDNVNLTPIYEFSSFVNELDIADVPANSHLYIEIAKNDVSEFSESADLTGVISIVSSAVELRTIDCVSTPADIMAKVLVNNRGTSKGLKIKLLGDSITHGVGSDDFEYGSETVVIQQAGASKTFYRNIGANSWAAKFAAYMSGKYGATVINNGLSGTKSTQIIDNWDVLVDGDEDLIICMIGTNDRMEYNDQNLKDTFYNRMKTIVNLANCANIPIILMSVIPVSVHYETQGADGVPHDFTMHAEDVENIIHQVAYINHLGYVSMFNGMLDYCDYTDTSVDDLLEDQLHPNNAGHNVMYKILMRSLGLGRKIDGATW